MQTTLQYKLESMWKDYCDLNPQAGEIYGLFKNEEPEVLNDHIAFRTFRHPKGGIDNLAQHFTPLGYKMKGEYHFETKKLFAKHFQHPDPQFPKIFISEFILEKGSPELQKIVHQFLNQLSPEKIKNENFPWSGTHWKISKKDYDLLAQESEYAAWVSAIGFRPNHFTIAVNSLKKYNDIYKLNDFLKKHDFKLNSSGGEVKGSAEELLEQSSTLAFPVKVQFEEGTFSVPGCYYEFAKRYSQKDGTLYEGFIAKSADKIFESTNQMQD